jgi:hypothetical protein
MAVGRLPELVPLVGTKGKALFAKKNQGVADRAVADGYLTKLEVAAPSGKGKKKAATTVYGVITEAGSRKAVEACDDRTVTAVLQTLLGVIQNWSATTSKNPQPDAATISNLIREATPTILSTVEQATHSAVIAVNATVEKAFGELRELLGAIPGSVERAVMKAIPGGMPTGVKNALNDLEQKVSDAIRASTHAPPISTDHTPVLSALQTVLGQLKAEPKVIRVPVMNNQAIAPPSLNPKPDIDAAIADEIVTFVTNWAREKTVGPPFDAIMTHLRVRHRELTVGAFHDALRRLATATQPRLELSVWSKTIHELPEPELALFVKHKVMYYAHPTH